MDKEFIERYELDTLKQEEFGTVDNGADIGCRTISELFAIKLHICRFHDKILELAAE